MKLSLNKTTLKERLTRKHTKKDIYSRYRGMFYFVSFLGLVCMAISTAAGTEFYYSMVESKLGTWGYAVAFGASAVVVAAIWWFSEHVADLWFEENSVDIFALFMLGFLALTFYTDFNGSVEIAEKIEDSPTDSKSEGIQANIDAIKTKEDKIFSHYGWCAKHSSKHLNSACKNLVKPSTPAQLRGAAEHGYNVAADRKTLSDLAKEKAVYVSQLDANTAEYTESLGDYKQRLERRKTSYKGVSIIANLIMVVITFFRSYWGTEVAVSEDVPASSGERALRKLEQELSDFREERRLMEEREKEERKRLEAEARDLKEQKKRLKKALKAQAGNVNRIDPKTADIAGK